MQPLSVIEDFDPLKDRAPGFLAGPEVPVPNQFVLEAAEKTLGDGIVITVALAAHTRDHAVHGQELPVARRRVQHPLIAVMDEPRGGLAAFKGHHQRLGGGRTYEPRRLQASMRGCTADTGRGASWRAWGWAGE